MGVIPKGSDFLEQGKNIVDDLNKISSFPVNVVYPTGIQEVLRRHVFPELEKAGYKYSNNPLNNQFTVWR